MVKWWDKKWGPNKVCGISHSRLRPGKNSKGSTKCVYLDCGHGFYRKCLQQWIFTRYKAGKEKMTCPMCRKEFNILKGFT